LRGVTAVTIGGKPCDPQRRQPWIVGGRETGFQARIELGVAPTPRRGNRDYIGSVARAVLWLRVGNPCLEQALLERARGIGEEHHPLTVAYRPARISRRRALGRRYLTHRRFPFDAHCPCRTSRY